jgi:hypothetical protein
MIESLIHGRLHASQPPVLNSHTLTRSNAAQSDSDRFKP